MRSPFKHGDSAPIEPAADWRWRSDGMSGSKPLVTSDQLVDLLRAVGGPDVAWLTVESGRGEGHCWAQAFGDKDALRIEVSEPFGWASRVTDQGVPPRDAIFTAREAAPFMSLWLAREELPPEGYGLVEVAADDHQPRRPT
jgi:hypothetical protein